MARKISRKGLIQAVDKAFSRYIRQKHADDTGYVHCVTCGKGMSWTEIQAGHFCKRGHAALRWNEFNVYPQCAGCNLFKNGAQDEMAAHIVRVHGPEVLQELVRLKHVEKRWSMSELRELLERYKGD